MNMATPGPALYGPPQRVWRPCLQAGAGKPLVFVHGVMGDWQTWAPQWAAFCAQFRCTTYSRRYNHPNHKAMPSPDHPALVEAEDLAQFMAELGMPRAVLLVSVRLTAEIHAEVFHNVCQAMPQAQVLHVDGAGHPVPRDQPHRFNAAALAFLNAAGLGQAPPVPG